MYLNNSPTIKLTKDVKAVASRLPTSFQFGITSKALLQTIVDVADMRNVELISSLWPDSRYVIGTSY